MPVITYSLSLLEPTLATGFDGDPNSVVSYPFLPGSLLRGAVIGLHLRSSGSTFDPADDKIRRRFLNGSTRFLNAYPIESRRSLPVPRSWMREKGRDQTIYDPAADQSMSATVTQPESISQPFCMPYNMDESGNAPPSVRLLRPEREISVHIARAARSGRPQKGNGAVFRYDALAAQQTFGAAILADHGDDANALYHLLHQALEMRLGKSSASADYGRARITGLTLLPDTGNTTTPLWRETDPDLDILGNEEDVVITLMSHALLRDNVGQHSTDRRVIADAVRQVLGVSEGDFPLKRAYLGSEHVGGFNRTWGLPLPQQLAISMGSVLVFDPGDFLLRDDAEDLLRRLESRGIGERRAEGFGRLAVNWHVYAKWTVHNPRAVPGNDLAVKLDTHSPAGVIAASMAKRLLLRELDDRLGVRIISLSRNIHGPKPSQIERVRAEVQRALALPSNASLGALLAFFAELRKRQLTRRQFTQDVIEGQPLLDWMEARIQDTEKIRQELKFETTDPALPRIGNVTVDEDELVTLARSYSLRLIDGVLAHAARAVRDTDAQRGGSANGG